ncbi:MAG TPA: PAS domain S-box protein, partial [Opitutaceae bacterium]|nr:PAS domain S-box protein [Opitutaceae bacterium]
MSSSEPPTGASARISPIGHLPSLGQSHPHAQALATIMGHSPQAMWIVADEHFVHANHAAGVLLGHGPASGNPVPVHQHVAPESLPALRHLCHAAVQTHPSPLQSIEWITSDGQRRSVELAAIPIGHQDRPATLLMATDVAPRPLNPTCPQDALKTAQDAIFIQKDLHFVYLNEAALRLFGATSADQLLGRPIMERVPAGQRAMTERRLPMSMLLSVCIGSALLMASLSDDITLHDHQRGKIVERLESAYHALQNQEHQLRTLFDHLPDPIVVIDESTLYYANEAAHRLHSILFPSQPQASRWLAILPAHRLLSDERTLRAEDGLDHIIEVRSAPFVWSGHSGRLCTLRDLTGQRKTESALHASETRFERIFQLCPDAIIIVSHDEQRIVELNDSCERLLGLRREETLGRLITEIGLWPDLTRRASLLDEVAIHGEVRGREEQLRHRNGERLTVEVSSRNMTWNGSRYLVSILANITERKRAEVALRASEERHRLLLENLHDLVFEVDAHGVCRYASPNHELLLGFAPDHLVDKAMIDMIHPEDRPAFLLHQSQASEAPMRIRVINSANQWRLLECSYCNLRTPEGSHRSIVNARDVTDHVHEQEERLKLERQLRQAQKLEAIG